MSAVKFFIVREHIWYAMRKEKINADSKRVSRSEISYFDDDLNPVPRDRATWAVVREVDENGALLFEAQGFID